LVIKPSENQRKKERNKKGEENEDCIIICVKY